MKRTTFLLIAGMVCATVNAQTITDGLRYGIDNTLGNARFNAMSGAFGALGGEISSIALNPAGSAVFLGNNGTFSTTIDDFNNKSTYFGTFTESGETDFNVASAGMVFVFPNYDMDSAFKKFSLGLNFNQTQNFDNDLFFRGNGNTSVAQFFLQQAQGVPLNLLQTQENESISDLYAFLGRNEGVAAQNAFLGYQGFIIDPVEENPNNSAYVSNVAGNSFNQEYYQYTRGYMGKYTLNFGSQIGERFFLGVNLNTHSILYDESNFLRERNSNQGSSVSQIGFENLLRVRGTGFSMQFGGIAKVTEAFRIGLTYDTPTWHDINEETTQYLETRRMEGGNTLTTIVDPRVINVFGTYNLNTPGRWAASMAYVFGQDGLISVDYSYRDFSNIKFKPTSDPYFAALNADINRRLQGVSTIRIGGEYRISQFSLRGGYRYEGSPYKDKTTLGDLNGFSAGIGYNFGFFSFDFSYAHAKQERNQQLYTIGLTDSARIETVTNNYIFTLATSL
ncbi:OmpP1/FadL family transporter [Aureitalea marina]|uniref:Transporter n=1 Tax=Aureitalea marina TaxID=930804 RepID=A0A2S7KQI6_9FLAO|nr:outer membrane protein transport protein [Aureitalea marina]PQB04881.1 hypothetical protein BST85_08260 [Aureitalea marina]